MNDKHQTNKHLKQTLDDIAAQTVPDDIDLWPAISAHIKPENEDMKRSIRNALLRQITRAAATLIMVALFSAGAYALYNQIDNVDSTIQRLNEADLVTEINMQQTQNDITLSLDWAYADAHRVALAYSTIYNTFETSLPEGGILVNARLFDANGTELPAFLGGGGGGGGDGSGERLSTANANFDPSELDFDGDQLPLALQLTVEAAAASPFYMPPPASAQSGERSGSGGGGGGGVARTDNTDGEGVTSPGGLQETDETLADPIPLEDFEPITYTFEFEVPFFPAQRINVAESMTVNDTLVTLETMTVTPSLTTYRLCYDHPDDDRTWGPAITIMTEETTLSRPPMAQPSDTPGRTCVEEQISLPIIPGTTESIQITVHYLRSSFANSDENKITVIQAIADAGFEFDVFQPTAPDEQIMRFAAGPVAPITIEEAEPLEQAVEDAYLSLSDSIQGPWTFTVEFES